MKEFYNSKGELLTGKASVDMPHLRFMPKGAEKEPLPEMTIFDYIYWNNIQHSDEIALEYFGNKIKYSKFFDEIDSAAKAFYSSGIREGDTVSLVMPTTPEFVYSLLALNRLGVRADVTNFLLSDEDDLKKIVSRSNSEHMVLMDGFYGKFKNVINDLPIKGVVNVSAVESASFPVKLIKKSEFNRAVKKGKTETVPQNDPKFRDWNTFIKDGKNTTYEAAQYVKDKPTVMVSTSGTTGFPKSINLSDNGIVSTLHTHKATDGHFYRGLRYLNIIPSIYTTTITSSLLLPLSFGVALILDPRFDRNLFGSQIWKYKPDYCLVNSNHWEALLSDPLLQGKDLSFLKYPVTGGDALSVEVEERTNKFFKDHTLTPGVEPTFIRKGWGLSELGAAVSYTHFDSKPGSVGKSFPHFTVGVFNPDTNEELDYNEYGELRVITPSRMVGYDQNEEATSKVFELNPNDGKVWGRSYDIGRMDPDGDIYIDGPRGLDDSIKNEGQDRVYAFPVDSALSLSKDVEFSKTVSAIVYDETLECEKEVLITHIKFTENEDQHAKLIQVGNDYLFDLDESQMPFAFKIMNEVPIASSGKKDIEFIRGDRKDLIKVVNGNLYNLYINKDKKAIYLKDNQRVNLGKTLIKGKY